MSKLGCGCRLLLLEYIPMGCNQRHVPKARGMQSSSLTLLGGRSTGWTGGLPAHMIWPRYLRATAGDYLQLRIVGCINQHRLGIMLAPSRQSASLLAASCILAPTCAPAVPATCQLDNHRHAPAAPAAHPPAPLTRVCPSSRAANRTSALAPAHSTHCASPTGADSVPSA
jgi:hypothetical protein